jgi:hypothetical protein
VRIVDGLDTGMRVDTFHYLFVWLGNMYIHSRIIRSANDDDGLLRSQQRLRAQPCLCLPCSHVRSCAPGDSMHFGGRATVTGQL